MKKLLIITAVLMLLSTQLYAGNGDLIVNGNLGVGTGSPNTKLELKGGHGDTTARLYSTGFGQPAANDDAYLSLWASEPGWSFTGVGIGNNINGSVYYGRINSNRGASYIRLGDNAIVLNTINSTGTDTNNMYMSGGNVGIGTTSPDASHKLHVNGESRLGAVTLTPGNGNWWPRTNGDAAILNDNNGFKALMIVGSDQGQGNTRWIRMWDTVTVEGTLRVNGPAYSTGGWLSSDITFKRNIHPIDESLNKLLNLNGVSYEWKTDEYKDKGFPEGRHYGVIAQEIEKVLPEVVNTAPDGTKSVAYTEIIPVLIEAMKAQQKAIDAQHSEINDLKDLVKQLTSKK